MLIVTLHNVHYMTRWIYIFLEGTGSEFDQVYTVHNQKINEQKQ